MDGGETTGNEIADERSDPDRREACHRIISDHEFEAVEGAGERRAELKADGYWIARSSRAMTTKCVPA
jgi:hypothetical protein